MKKRIPSILATVLAMVLVFSLSLTALAASGQVTFGGKAVYWSGKKVIAADETITASNGAAIPGSITYIDEKNGGTVYLPLRKLSELLDASVDYDGATETVFIGGVPTFSGGGTISIPGGPSVPIHPSADEDSIPTYTLDDTQMGPFTKVEAQLPATGAASYPLLMESRFQSRSDFDQNFRCTPANGKYVSVTVVNNNTASTEELIVNLAHGKAIGPKEAIPSFRVKPGETVTCTFALNETATERNCNLELNVTYGSGAPYTMDVTVSAVQFDVK